MRHLIRYSLKESLRNVDTIFWQLCFPLILALLFFFSFMGGGDAQPKLKQVDTGLVIAEKNDSNTSYKAFLEELDDVVELHIYNQNEAKMAMAEGKIDGYFYLDDERTLVVSGAGVEQSLLKALLDGYNQNEYLIMETIKSNPQNVTILLEKMQIQRTYTKEVTFGGATLESDIQYFFALIGMACMYGSFSGLFKVQQLQANISALGARRSISPTNKLKLIVTDFIVLLGIHFGNMVVLLLFLKYVLKLDFQGSMGGMLLVCFMGTCIGVSVGIMIGSISHIKEGAKIGIVIAVSMIFSFLSGLMVDAMKYMVERNLPIVNRLNPVALISDAFYCLTVYQDTDRYYRNLITLACMSVVCIIISFMTIRRTQYDSI